MIYLAAFSAAASVGLFVVFLFGVMPARSRAVRTRMSELGLDAMLSADARAERIVVEDGRLRGVSGRVVDGAGRPHGRIEVEAPVVVLAAGAVASPDLLLRSGVANRSGQVGNNLHLHPAVMAAGIFDEEIHAYRGIPQSFYVDEFIDLDADPHRGVVLMPITGFPVLTSVNYAGFGRAHYAQMRDFPRTAGLLALLHDRSLAFHRARLDRAREEVIADMPEIARKLGLLD